MMVSLLDHQFLPARCIHIYSLAQIPIINLHTILLHSLCFTLRENISFSLVRTEVTNDRMRKYLFI